MTYTHEQQATIAEMNNNGESANAIAKSIGSYPQAVKVWLIRNGHSVSHTGRGRKAVNLTESQKDRIVEAYRAKTPIYQIANQLEIGQVKIREALQERGIEIRKGRTLEDSKIEAIKSELREGSPQWMIVARVGTSVGTIKRVQAMMESGSSDAPVASESSESVESAPAPKRRASRKKTADA